jgi:FKBP-type peptidyl-prolyl cis-trans isomerase 2
MTVQNNDTVKVHYTGTLADGSIFDSSIDREPLEFTLGKGMLIPGFEKTVLGMSINETRTCNIPTDEAYGSFNPELVQEVSKSQLPEDLLKSLEVGLQLVSSMPDGSEFPVVVAEIHDAHIVVDANHPLAGEDLNFEITLVSIY